MIILILNIIWEILKLSNTLVLQYFKWSAAEREEKEKRLRSLIQDLANINKDMRPAGNEEAILAALDIERKKIFTEYKRIIENILAAGGGLQDLSKQTKYRFDICLSKVNPETAILVLTSANNITDKATDLAALCVGKYNEQV